MKTKLFTLLLAVAASVGTLFAWDYEYVKIGDLYYNLDATSQTAEVMSQNSGEYSGDIVIPASVTYNSVTYSVTSIGGWAFQDCRGLTSVTIPNSVTSIGGSAFYGCSGLTSVTIPNSVTSIGNNAFYGCSGLTSIEIPNSVTSIGEYAFSRCSNLTSVTIGNSVTSIGGSAFYGCSGLTSVTIPNSVTSIGWDAFYGCTGLTSVTIPNSVTSIGDRAFYGCSNLTSVTLGNSVTSIGWDAFYNCSGLKKVNITDIAAWCNITFDGYQSNPLIYAKHLYVNDVEVTDVVIPNSVTSIGDRAFYGCSGLTSVAIPNSVTSIGDRAFYGCSGLTSMGAPAGFFNVPEQDWPSYTKNLNQVTVNGGELTENALLFINRSYKTLQTLDVSGATNTEFADEAFKGYYNLQQLVLPAGLQKVGYMMVAGCINLQSIDIPASVEEIDQRAFEDCRSIKTITFGENPSLIRIGNWAFYNCHDLQNLEIPEGVTEIGDGAFYGCTYLKNLNLPASVQSIGDNGFAFCSKLQKMVVHAVTPPDIDYKTFEEVSRQTPVYVPDESVDEYENHPLWKEFFIQGISNMPQGLEDVSSSLQGGNRGRLILRDGQIFILRGDRTYTLTGQELK